MLNKFLSFIKSPQDSAAATAFRDDTGETAEADLHELHERQLPKFHGLLRFPVSIKVIAATKVRKAQVL